MNQEPAKPRTLLEMALSSGGTNEPSKQSLMQRQEELARVIRDGTYISKNEQDQDSDEVRPEIIEFCLGLIIIQLTISFNA